MTVPSPKSWANWPPSPRIRLALFGVVAVVSVATGFLAFDVNHARRLVENYGYYTISVTCAWACFALWRLRASFSGRIALLERRDWRTAAGVVLLCAAVAWLTAPITYKVLYDEMVLQATAWHLHFFREIKTIVRGYTIDGVFVPLDAYLDKRPFFFVYVVSLLHDLTGYREANAFYLNMALLPVVLFQAYLVARRIAAHPAAMVAVVTLGTLSLLAHNGTGAGMELMNLAMLLLTMQLAMLYLDAPDAPRLSALLLSAVLLAQTRYESSLYVVPTAVVALEGWRRSGRIILPPAAILAPALLIPYALHNTYLSGTPLLWELKENDKTRFELRHLVPNLQHALNYLFNTSRLMTNSLWLSSAGAASLAYGAFVLWRARRAWRQASSASVVLVLFGAVMIANLTLLMFYYWGQLDDPIVGRLSLPVSVLMALAIAYAIGVAAQRFRGVVGYAIGAAVLAYVATGLGANAQHTGLNTLDRELLWERRYVAELPPGDRLIITNKSTLPWLLSHRPAISIEQARHRTDAVRFQLENRTFREILVFQNLRPTSAVGDFQIDPADRLPDGFKLEPVAERRFGTRLNRVSRVTRVDRDLKSTAPGTPTPAPASAPSTTSIR